ncbi:MAG: FimV/HubP family polar landmark protein, partial [Mariprofundus sp.]
DSAARPTEAETLPMDNDQGWARIWRYGPVRAGDNLSEIAYRLRRDKRYSNRAVMLSLFEENPHGFVEGDINHLKKGAWLTVPSGAVVKTYESHTAMQRLSKLLNPPKAAAKPRLTVEVAQQAQAPATPADQELRYSGKISMNGASAEQAADAGVDKQFDAIHEEMMAGKLQMAELGSSVSNLNQSVEVIRQDISDLKKDVEFIKAKAAEPSTPALFSDWQIALIALLAAIFGALVATLFRRKGSPEYEPIPVQTAVAEEEDPFAGEEPEPAPLADEVVQLLNQTEESLGRCEFEEVEQMLGRLNELAPGSLRALVLKAQLYHETDRHNERNDLINSISESSDKDRWEQFCQLLPSHVWNACFGDELLPDDGSGGR